MKTLVRIKIHVSELTKNSLTAYFFCACLMSQSTGVFAQEAKVRESTARENLVVKDIVVTGTRTEKEIDDSPVKTETLSSKRIQDQRYRDSAEAILDIPGVTTFSSTGRLDSTPIIQGLGGERVLILIDGVPALQRNSSGADLSVISTADIQKIEVVKGGASALYGSQAMGGVINIITKKPQQGVDLNLAMERDFVGNQSLIENKDTSTEDPAYNSLRVHAKGKLNRFGFSAAVTHNQRQSIERDPRTLTRDTPEIDKKILRTSVSANLNNKTKIQMRAEGYEEKNQSFVAGLLGSGELEARTNSNDMQGTRLGLDLISSPSDRFDYKINLTNDRLKEELILNDRVNTAQEENFKLAETGKTIVEYQGNILLNDSHVLTTGAFYSRDTLAQDNNTTNGLGQTKNSEDISDKTSESMDAYLQDDWIFGNQELVTGLRYTRESFFGENFAPKLNHSYKKEMGEQALMFRASIGSGYRIPNLKERFYFLDHRSIANYIVQGNENLAPEQSRSFQYNIDLVRKSYYKFSVGYFFNQVDNLIVTEQAQSETSELILTYKNIEEAEIDGFEFSSDVELGGGLKTSSALTYTNPVNKSTGNTIPNRNIYIGRLDFTKSFNDERTNAIVIIRYFGESFADNENTLVLDDHFQTDLKFNLNLKKDLQALTVFGGIRNIFNALAPAADDSGQNNTQPGVADGNLNTVRPALGQVVYAGIDLKF